MVLRIQPGVMVRFYICTGVGFKPLFRAVGMEALILCGVKDYTTLLHKAVLE